MNRDQKAAVIDEVASQIEEAQAIFAVDYRGLTVKQAADLRGRLIEIDANLRVVKNTLTERAADKAGVEGLKQFLEGPTAFTFVKGDPVLAAKALAAFRRESQLPEFKGGWMDGRELSIADIEALSRLPSLEVMHGQLVGMIASPLVGLVRSLNALLSGIAVALGQIQEQGLVGGDAPAETEAVEADAEVATTEPEAEAEAPAEAEAAAPAEVEAEAPAEAEAAAPAEVEPEAPAEVEAPAEAEAAGEEAEGPADAPAPDAPEGEADAPAADAPAAEAESTQTDAPADADAEKASE
jgi:large subunit ribosomal protein L10